MRAAMKIDPSGVYSLAVGPLPPTPPQVALTLSDQGRQTYVRDLNRLMAAWQRLCFGRMSSAPGPARQRPDLSLAPSRVEKPRVAIERAIISLATLRANDVVAKAIVRI